MKPYWSTTGAVVALAIPPAVVLHLICTKGVNVPYFDEWSLVPLVLKSQVGAVAWFDLWQQHNEHRIVSVRLITLLLLPFTRFNLVSHMLVAFAMALGSLMFLWRALRWTFPTDSTRFRLSTLVVVSVFVFSLVQWEAWIYSMPALQSQLTTLCAAVAVWALSRWPGQARALVVCGGAALVSTTALASGVVLWCAAIVTIVVQRRQRGEPVRRVVVAGAGVCVAILAAFFSAYNRPAGHPDPIAALGSPFDLLYYVAAYLGLPLAYGRRDEAVAGIGGLAFAVSTTLLALMVMAIRRTPARSAQAAAPWLALWLYSVAVAFLTAAGRAGLGLATLAPRYAASAALFWVASSVIAALAWRRYRDRVRGPWRAIAAVAGCIVGLIALAEYGRANTRALEVAGNLSTQLAFAQTHLRELDSAPAAVFEVLYPPAPFKARRYSGLLRHARLGPFAGSHNAEPTASQQPELVADQDDADCRTITGWAMDYLLPGRAISVDVIGDDILIATVSASQFRQDVLDEGIGTGRYGFSVNTPPALKDGQPHRIVLRVTGTMQTLFEGSIQLRCDGKASGGRATQ